MTKTERELLLLDLSARFQYGVTCHYVPMKEDDFDKECDFKIRCIDTDGNIVPNRLSFRACYNVENVKPYLRPLDDMTEEEDKEFALLQTAAGNSSSFLYPVNANAMVNWLYSNGFDINFLIDKGLAIEKRLNNEENKEDDKYAGND